MKTEHFTSEYVSQIEAFIVTAETSEGKKVHTQLFLYSKKDEISQAAVNWIVENLNKLAEHNAKKDVVS